MTQIASRTLSPGFRTASLRGIMPMGHILNIDHFEMSEPTFPPHPHAGFSAVTWMLPWSPGAFANRDSRGDRSRIGPGSLHWTWAGSGMVHEEIPETRGIISEGLQIFVKLPEALEFSEPRAFHLDPEAIPRVHQGGSSAQVLVGALEGQASPIPSTTGTTMLHVSVDGAFSLEVPAGVQAFALGLRGEGRLGGAPFGRHSAVALAAGPQRAEGSGLELLVAWSEALPRSPAFRGPFCMFDPERIAEAERSYRAGAMGRLD